MYLTAIVDECGDVVYWIYDMSPSEVERILDSHPEWSKRAIFVGGD